MSGAYDTVTLEAKFNGLARRLDHIEEHLVRISQQFGGYTPFGAGVPDEVVSMLRGGDRLGAMKKYREVTGASFDQARDALAAL